MTTLRAGADDVVFRLWGEIEWGWRGGRVRGVAPPSRDVSLAQALAGRNPSPAVLAQALAYALREGAFESAEALLELLLPQLDQLTGHPRRVAIEDAVDALIMVGNRSRALLLARENAEFARTARGMSLLELLEPSGRAFWLPGGRPNLLALSRQIRSGALDAAGFRSVIARKPWAWLTHPELHLLAFMAERTGAHRDRLRGLNRFLAWHGLPRLAWSDRALQSANFLAALATLDRRPACVPGPLVSVIVAARNAQSTLRYAMESIFAQNYRRIEILACDDVSDDSTLQLLRELRRTDTRLRVFRSQRQQGAYNVRNALAQHALGDLLTFHDADDFALATRVAEQVVQLRSGEASACVASLLRVTPDGQVAFYKNQRATRLSLVTLMLSRRLFFDYGGFRPVHFGGDWELYVRLRERLGAHGFTRILAPLMLALWSPDSTTRAANREALEDGYRSPARRMYSQIALAGQGLAPAVPVAEQQSRLMASGIYAEPSEIVELVD